MKTKRRLSSRTVETERRLGYHADAQQPGLYLQIHDGVSGITKSWIYRFTSPKSGKRREMGLGTVEIRSLADARSMVVQYRKLVLDGLDPVEEKRREVEAQFGELEGGTGDEGAVTLADVFQDEAVQDEAVQDEAVQDDTVPAEAAASEPAAAGDAGAEGADETGGDAQVESAE